MSEAYESLKGTIEDITYMNEDNGYCVFTVESGGEPITVVGTLPYISIGEQIELKGHYIIHPQYK